MTNFSSYSSSGDSDLILKYIIFFISELALSGFMQMSSMLWDLNLIQLTVDDFAIWKSFWSILET